MKILKFLLMSIILMSLTGCFTVGQSGYARYSPYSYQSNYWHSRDTGLQMAPCVPFEAGQIMDWAKGLPGGSYHKKSATVTNNNGRVNCRTRESAGSRE
jgi:hypothetical protein